MEWVIFKSVIDWSIDETERQRADPDKAIPLAKAYLRAVRNPELIRSVDGIISLHSIFEPGHAGLRQVPAVFHQGPPAISAELVPATLDRLLDFRHEITPDEFVKEFLCIHPFSDGNGRMGSIIWNVLNGNDTAPTPMPYYFGAQ